MLSRGIASGLAADGNASVIIQVLALAEPIGLCYPYPIESAAPQRNMKERAKKTEPEPTQASLLALDTDETEVAQTQSEEEDRASSPPSYEVVTYPADFTLEVLVAKLKGDPPEIDKPGFQRKFVWTQAQASKLIESFLLGLPVPPIFVFTDAVNRQMVVDGQQRLKSIAYFFEGYFGPEEKGRRPVFRLTGLNE